MGGLFLVFFQEAGKILEDIKKDIFFSLKITVLAHTVIIVEFALLSKLGFHIQSTKFRRR